MKKFRKVLIVAVPAVMLLVAVWLMYLAKTRLPILDGEIVHPFVQNDVRVVRDDWGVPHIEAANETDAYFALGYVLAQDRLFQMEVMRRLARGELAEVLGPLLIRIDKILRSFRLRAHAETYLAQSDGLPPEIRQAAEAFVAGINYRMEHESLPFEFAALRIPARPFTLVDCLAVAGVLLVTFAEGLRTDPLVTLLKERHPDLDIDALFPGYTKEIPVTVMETLEEADAYLKAHGRESTSGGAEVGKLHESLAALREFLGHLQSISAVFGPALGSNSWVLGPSRTRSGKAILANDPHITFTNPGIWYEAHLRYGDYDLYGYYLPLVPFALLGHNRRYAWALTMFENDDLDLYRETFKPDDPTKVMYKGEWVDVRMEAETIKVRFWPDQHYLVRITPHGPVITDLFRKVQGYEGPEVALSWVWQQVRYTDVAAVYKMGHATDCESFGQALALITSPGLNVSYADAQGTIAWWAAGRIPIRPKHVNPKTLLDGASGNDEILGYVPFEQNPHLKNPACGYIVTANNKSTVKPVGPVEDIEGYWQPTDRAGRIKQLLETQAKWSVEELKVLQLDDVAYAGPGILQPVMDALNASRSTFTPLEQSALDALTAWDYRHGVESVGAGIYEILCSAILKHALQDELGEQLLECYFTVADHWNFFKYFIRDEASPYWDDITTPRKETRQEIILQSFRDTVATLRQRLGKDMNRWTWGRFHTMTFRHAFGYVPLLGRIFNIGPFPASGGAEAVNHMLYRQGDPPYPVIAGPSTRRLIDFADPEHSLTILPTGNSGNFMSPYYADQARMFMAGAYREPRLTPEQIEAHRMHEIRFKPAPPRKAVAQEMP